MNNKYFIGSQVQNLDILNKTNPITEVILWLDDETCVKAGSNDGTGYTLEATCASATQAMADAILASVHGKQYQGLRGDNALSYIGLELGDGMDIGGYYTLVGSQTITFGADLWNIAAPINGELEKEYPYLSPQVREMKRVVDQAMASLSVLSDSITAEITDRENADSNLSSRIEQTLSGISFTVTNGDKSSTLSMTATKEDGSSITIGSQNITFNGVVTFSDLSTSGSTTINGSNITTGTISAARLDSSVIVATDLSNPNSGTVINGSNITTGSINAGLITSGVIDAQYIATDISQVDYDLYLGGTGDASCGVYFGNDSNAYINNTRNGDLNINSGYQVEIIAEDGVFLSDNGIYGLGVYSIGSSARIANYSKNGYIDFMNAGDIDIKGDTSVYITFDTGAYYEFQETVIYYYNNSGVRTTVWSA